MGYSVHVVYCSYMYAVGYMILSLQVILTITDMNDQSPSFVQNGCGDEVQIPEDFRLGDIVCQVLATDDDEPGTDAAIVSYSLIGSDVGK